MGTLLPQNPETKPENPKLLTLQTLLTLKHPTFHKKAILNLARTMLSLDADEDHDDETEAHFVHRIRVELHLPEAPPPEPVPENPVLRPDITNLYASSPEDLAPSVHPVSGPEALAPVLEIDRLDATGHTQMHLAVHTNDQATVILLLQKNPNLTLRDPAGNTPYMLAVLEGYDAIAQLIRAHKLNH